jgi:hypothetical protein
MSAPETSAAAESTSSQRGERSPAAVFMQVALMVAVAVHLLGLRAPLILDDYAQRAMASGRVTPSRGPLDLYDYIDDRDRSFLFDCGAIPWWTSPRLTVRFLRPLSSALVWFDQHAFGYEPYYAHVHSLLWWGLGVAAALLLFRRSMKARPAGLATAIFALASCHTPPLLWLANRDVLVSTAFGTFAIALYLRWRSHMRMRIGLATVLAFFAAFFSGEYALCFVGYVVAIEFTQSGQSASRRLIGLTVPALPALTYALFYLVLNYGAQGSGFYRSPLSDPAGYVLGAPRRAATLLASAWLGLPDGFWLTPSTAAMWGVGVGTVVVVWLLFRHSLVRLEGAERRSAQWLLGGATLAVIPLLAAEPSVRLLGAVMVGVSGVLALVFESVLSASFAPRPKAVTAIVSALAAIHFIWAPIDSVRIMRQTRDAVVTFARRFSWVPRHLSQTTSTVFIVRANSPPVVLWAPFMLGEPAPARWRTLSFGAGPIAAIRTGPRTVELVAAADALFPTGPFDWFRRAAELRVGDVIDVAGLRATILELGEHQGPRRVGFDFDRDADDPAFQWITEGIDGFREVALPPVGIGVSLAP